jgi:hypothetical protein
VGRSAGIAPSSLRLVQRFVARRADDRLRVGFSTDTLYAKETMHIAIVSALLYASVAVVGEPERETPILEKCGVMHKVDGNETLEALPSLHVIEVTASGAFVLPKDAPLHVSAISCGRTSFVPEKNDFKVLLAGFPFFIVAPDDRVATLELSNGRLQYRAIEGEFSSDEILRIEEYLTTNQEAFYKPSAK